MQICSFHWQFPLCFSFLFWKLFQQNQHIPMFRIFKDKFPSNNPSILQCSARLFWTDLWSCPFANTIRLFDSFINHVDILNEMSTKLLFHHSVPCLCHGGRMSSECHLRINRGIASLQTLDKNVWICESSITTLLNSWN